MSCITAMIDSIFFVRWQRPEIRDLTHIQAEVSRVRGRHKGPIIYLAIVPTDADPPDTDVRKAMMDSMDGVLAHCEAMYFVIEGAGFKHSVLRSALAGILLVAGRRGRVFVETSVEDALADIAKRLRIESMSILRQARTNGVVPPAH